MYTSSQQGGAYSEVYPHVSDLMDDPLRDVEEAEGIDTMFIAAPPGVSAELTPLLSKKGIRVIDLSGDLRLKKSGEYEKWYGRTAAPEEMTEAAVYGLSEINREKIRNADILSNPGCYPTASLLGLAPLLKHQQADTGSIIIDAKSGVSGAGRKAGLGTHYSELNENLKVYKPGEHQHTPEIEQQLSEWAAGPVTISFTPHLVPMTRGILTTMYVQLNEPVSTESLLDSYRTFYENDPFVRIRKPGNYPQTKEVTGSNFCDIGLKVDERTGRAVIAAVIDNLMKGAAGQAVQNYNLMNGWDERTGLKFVPMYP